jgi:hypothetical protein
MLADRYVDHDKVGAAGSNFFCHDARQYPAAEIDPERVFPDDDLVIGRGDMVATRSG